MTLPLSTVADLGERLKELHVRTRETPLFNPVFQLGLDLSRRLEGGGMGLDAVESLVAELECNSLKVRANRLERLLAPVDAPANRADLASVLKRDANFDAFKARWETPSLHAVFTAHPTFLLTPAQTSAVADGASKGTKITQEICAAGGERPAVTLKYEHAQAMAAIADAQDARADIVAKALDHAAAKWPDQWQDIIPLPFRFATWVGYDMDGRTDIKWYTSILFRLQEKAMRIARYVTALEAIDVAHPLLATLREAGAHTEKCAESFAGDLTDPR